MRRSGIRVFVFLFIFIGGSGIFTGCGGGGGGSGSSQLSGSITSLEWDPPKTFGDGTPIDPRRDIDHYEFYLRTDQNFSNSDEPVAQAAAVSSVPNPVGNAGNRAPTTEFALDNLIPFVERGKRYFVTIKAVGIDGLKSGFMVPVAWDVS